MAAAAGHHVCQHSRCTPPRLRSHVRNLSTAGGHTTHPTTGTTHYWDGKRQHPRRLLHRPSPNQNSALHLAKNLVVRNSSCTAAISEDTAGDSKTKEESSVCTRPQIKCMQLPTHTSSCSRAGCNLLFPSVTFHTMILAPGGMLPAVPHTRKPIQYMTS